MNLREQTALLERCSRFAREAVAPCSPDEFPPELWKRMGETGLLALGLGRIFGGTGGGYALLATAGEAFAREGRNMGLAMSWIYQQLVGRVHIQGFGSGRQRRHLRPMARGLLTTSFAVSEPGRGGGPRFLTATARRNGASYVLNGEKTYLTNGPIAGLYIVVAVTGETDGRKRFSAFLLPRETEGLTVAPSLTLPFLKSSPHGGITLSDCRVPEDAVLGEIGTAYDRLVIPFGQIEEIVLAGTAVGALSAQAGILIDLLRKSPTEAETTVLEALGALVSGSEAMRILVGETARRLDHGEPPSSPLSLIVSELWSELQKHLGTVAAAGGISVPPEYDRLRIDLAALASIRGKAIASKREKLGAAVLKGPS